MHQHFPLLATRWQQSSRPVWGFTHVTRLFAKPDYRLSYQPFTWVVWHAVCVYSTLTSLKKKKKNLITWLTECSGSMPCSCELGWKRNIHKLKLSINSLTVWDTTLWMLGGGGGVVCWMRTFLFIFWTRYFLEFGALSAAGKVGLRCGAPLAVQSIFKDVWGLLFQYYWNCVNQNFQIPSMPARMQPFIVWQWMHGVVLMHTPLSVSENTACPDSLSCERESLSSVSSFHALQLAAFGTTPKDVSVVVGKT